MSLLFPVCSFGRVFDTVPLQEVLTLGELSAALRRFEVKTETAHRIERDVARIEKGREALLRGEAPRGNFMGKLAKEAELARRAGRDEARAIEAKAASMIVDTRKGAKRDLRLWSPALYRPGAAKRGSENVTHVSCLVLDYDDGTSIAEATTTWSTWFHLVYTTWSHTAEGPRFRLVLPLAFNVRAEDWSKVWSWAEEHAHFEIDPSMKSPAATYALPAVPHRGWPREAFSRPGAILDPVDEGILARRSELELEPRRPPDGVASVIRGEDPEKEYIDHEDPDALYVLDEPWEEELEWEAPDELIEAVRRSAGVSEPETEAEAEPEPEPETETETETETDTETETETETEPEPEPEPETEPETETETETEPETEPASVLAALGDRLHAVLDRLDERATPAVEVDALERLVRLREQGWLTDAELRAAKKRILQREVPGDLRAVGPGRHRRTLCVGFDGVLHSYTSGWRGPTVIPDPPVDGAIAWLRQAAERFDLAIGSVRSAYPGAIEAMRAWLLANGLPERVLARIRFPLAKPPAEIYLDDRGYRFEGRFPSFEELGALERWNAPKRR